MVDKIIARTEWLYGDRFRLVLFQDNTVRMQARNGRMQDGSVPADPANPTETLGVLRASLWAYKTAPHRAAREKGVNSLEWWRCNWGFRAAPKVCYGSAPAKLVTPGLYPVGSRARRWMRPACMPPAFADAGTPT